MNVTDELKKFGIIPIDYAIVASLLGEYSSPKDKVTRMESKGDLIRLKKGLFIVAQRHTNQLYSRELIANHLYGPSYVSFETALSYYRLIPERVHLVKSMVTKRAKTFSLPVGNFEYIKANDDYFGVGLRQAAINDQYAFLMASPEKALCDMIVATHGLRLQSVGAMRVYLEEDMRIDLSEIAHWDIEIIRKAIDYGKKKTELGFLMEVLNGK